MSTLACIIAAAPIARAWAGMAQLEDADSLTELRKSILSFETKACGCWWHGRPAEAGTACGATKNSIFDN